MSWTNAEEFISQMIYKITDNLVMSSIRVLNDNEISLERGWGTSKHNYLASYLRIMLTTTCFGLMHHL